MVEADTEVALEEVTDSVVVLPVRSGSVDTLCCPFPWFSCRCRVSQNPTTADPPRRTNAAILFRNSLLFTADSRTPYVPHPLPQMVDRVSKEHP